jgi:hypothetical protein
MNDWFRRGGGIRAFLFDSTFIINVFAAHAGFLVGYAAAARALFPRASNGRENAPTFNLRKM